MLWELFAKSRGGQSSYDIYSSSPMYSRYRTCHGPFWAKIDALLVLRIRNLNLKTQSSNLQLKAQNFKILVLNCNFDFLFLTFEFLVRSTRLLLHFRLPTLYRSAVPLEAYSFAAEVAPGTGAGPSKLRFIGAKWGQ